MEFYLILNPQSAFSMTGYALVLNLWACTCEYCLWVRDTTWFLPSAFSYIRQNQLVGEGLSYRSACFIIWSALVSFYVGSSCFRICTETCRSGMFGQMAGDSKSFWGDTYFILWDALFPAYLWRVWLLIWTCGGGLKHFKSPFPTPWTAGASLWRWSWWSPGASYTFRLGLSERTCPGLPSEIPGWWPPLIKLLYKVKVKKWYGKIMVCYQ